MQILRYFMQTFWVISNFFRLRQKTRGGLTDLRPLTLEVNRPGVNPPPKNTYGADIINFQGYVLEINFRISVLSGSLRIQGSVTIVRYFIIIVINCNCDIPKTYICYVVNLFFTIFYYG
jgi:hypothetical protein